MGDAPGVPRYDVAGLLSRSDEYDGGVDGSDWAGDSADGNSWKSNGDEVGNDELAPKKAVGEGRSDEGLSAERSMAWSRSVCEDIECGRGGRCGRENERRMRGHRECDAGGKGNKRAEGRASSGRAAAAGRIILPRIRADPRHPLVVVFFLTLSRPAGWFVPCISLQAHSTPQKPSQTSLNVSRAPKQWKEQVGPDADDVAQTALRPA